MRDPDGPEDRSPRRWFKKWMGPAATVVVFAIRVYEALHGSHWHD
jgi:hypothetical protein